MDEVWLMVTPNNPLKDSKILAPEWDRFVQVSEAVKDIPGVIASDFEFYLPRPSYTADTLRELVSTYPNCDFSLIIGEDSLASIMQWKDYQYILNNFIIYVYPRHNCDVSLPIPKSSNIIVFYGAPYIDISSTEIRNKK